MSEPVVYGKSYWEIVVHAFRKNYAARAALWVSAAMIVVAILAPVLANDRPFTFIGTMPGEYQKAFKMVSQGAKMAILSMPARMRAERTKFETKKATLNEFLKRLTEAEFQKFYATYERLRKRAESRPETRGRWIARDVTLEEIEDELRLEEKELPGLIAELKKSLSEAGQSSELLEKRRTRLAEYEKTLPAIPTEIAWISSTCSRIVRDMPTVYTALLEDALQGLQTRIEEIADQLDESYRPQAHASFERITGIVGHDFIEAKDDRKPAIQVAIDDFKMTFDPEKVHLVPKRHWPLIDSLDALDVFFIALFLGVVLGFGPLTWLKLRKIQPLERRWAITWVLALVPAVLLSGLWFLGHKNRFVTVSYKEGVKDSSIQMSGDVWPPIRYRYDEVPTLQIERDEDRPPHPPSRGHLFGTDFMGRDLLSRMIWGSRVSLSIGFVAVAIALFIGITQGALAGFYRGSVDIVISRFIEIMICFPTFFLILAVVAFLPPNIMYVMLVLGLFGWMGIARLQRGEFLRLVNLDFVQAAIALGASKPRVIFRHILPNALAPVLVAASFGIAGAMLTESGLSFLGFGVQEPATSWGQILYTGKSHLEDWWTFTIPGIAIFVAVTCYNLVGDGIRDAADPRLKT